MAKKNNDTAGVVFDTQSKMVMSQGGTFERMKEKISAVRAVVPNKSNNEIVLVLQHFENSVDKAVQAFLEGSAVEILKEWNVTGKKKPKKKKKPKLQADPTPTPPPEEAQPEEEKEEEVNGFHANGESVLDGESLDSLSEQLDSVSLDAAELDSEPATSETTAADAESPSSSIAPPTSTTPQGGRNHQGSRGGGKNRHRANSNSSSSPLTTDSSQHTTSGNKKIASTIDRSVKDLQRCAVSLTRYRIVVKDEMDTSIKRMKLTFAELQNCLMDREVNLMAEMDKVKAEAMSNLDGRHKKAEELRRLTDQSASMSEDQLCELRADIKHFVSERKYDEDLGKALRFTFEIEPLKSNIIGFGSVYHPRTGYSTRSRCSSTSSSVTSPPLVEAPAPPSQPQPSSEHRPPPAKQIFQGNRRTFQGQGYHSGGGGHRYNGGSSYHDRNPNRSHYRGYHGNGSNSSGGGPGGDGGPASSQYANSNSRGPQNPSSTSSSSSTSSYNNRQDRSSSSAASNGLPQRPPRVTLASPTNTTTTNTNTTTTTTH